VQQRTTQIIKSVRCTYSRSQWRSHAQACTGMCLGKILRLRFLHKVANAQQLLPVGQEVAKAVKCETSPSRQQSVSQHRANHEDAMRAHPGNRKMKAVNFFSALCANSNSSALRAAFASMQFLCPGNFSILAMPLAVQQSRGTR